MITVIRTATAFPGMTGEAIAWAQEVAALVKRVTGKEQFVCTSFGGMLAEIAWIGQYDSVGQYDEMRTKVLSDGEYRTARETGSIATACLARPNPAISPESAGF